MKWLTLNVIKDQLRIEHDFTAEDGMLEIYGESAEDVLLNCVGRTYEDLMATYGKMPAPLKHASLMLCDVSYQYRSPISINNLSIVPSFDQLVKPYMRLTDVKKNDDNNNG